MITKYVGNNRVTLFMGAGFVHTVLPDGAEVVAQPQEGPEHLARAERLGYGTDLWAMCADHDLLHSVVAVTLGRAESHALRRAAEGLPPDDLAGAEEDAVMALQRLWNMYRGE